MATLTSPFSFPPRQCETLKNALKALGMPNIEDRDPFGRSCCDWRDIIKCSALLHITELRLPGKRLAGEIPFDLAKLSELEVLDLSNNSLSGTISDQLGNLPNLRELSISSNGLSGDLPAALKYLDKLEKLNLSANKFKGGLKVLADSHHLVELNLMDNNLSGPIELPWSKLSKLRILQLGRNQFYGPIPKDIAEASTETLQHLDLSRNNLTSNIPDSLAQFKSLSILKLDNNKLGGPILPQQLPSVRDTCILATASSGGTNDGNKFDCIPPNNNSTTSAASNKCLASLPPCSASKPDDAPAQAGSGFPITAIIAIVAGVLVLVGIALFFVIRRRGRSRSDSKSSERHLDAKPAAPVAPSFTSSASHVVGNPNRISFLVDANGNRHSVHIPAQAHVIDGSQFIVLPQPSYHGQGQAQAGGLARPSNMSMFSDPASLASSARVGHVQNRQPIYLMNAGSVGGGQAPHIPMPPMPHLFPNEIVYLGDNPRPSVSTVATATTAATTENAETSKSAVADQEQGGSVAGSGQGCSGAGGSAGGGGDGGFRETVADQPVSMVTVNVPDGYTVSLVPVNRPQTPGREA